MGLAERRALKSFQDEHLPRLVAEAEQLAGMALTIEIDWQSLVVENCADDLVEYWTKVYFVPLIEALRSITRDELGKSALKEGLTKIIIQNVSGAYYGDRWASFENGVLVLDHLPDSNIGDVQERTNGLIKVLEKGL